MQARCPARSTLPRARPWALAALLATASGGAHAASFDCRAAKTPVERAICGSAALSALDERVAGEYERARRVLSAAGAAQLQASQRDWLRFAARVCTPRAGHKRDESPADCLVREYKTRLGELAQAGIRVGPFVFNRVDFHAARRIADPDDVGAHAGFVTDHVAFPQIDAPLTPAAVAWNAAQRLDPPDTAGQDSVATHDDNDPVSDNDADFEIGCAGERFISMSSKKTYYVHGTAHGGYDHQVRNMILAPALRGMEAADIFAAGAPWKAKLPALFWSAYAHGADAATDMASVKQAILESGADPQRWLLTPAGLQISFDADEAGCYACNPGRITVPWSALKPMLASPDLAACRAPPAARP